LFDVLHLSIAQFDFPDHPNAGWESWVTLKDGSSELKGNVLGFNKDNIVMSLHKSEELIVPRKDILNLHVRKDRSINKSAEKGAWIGFGLGYFSSILQKEDKGIVKGKAFGRGILMGLGGGIIGYAIGSVRIKIPI